MPQIFGFFSFSSHPFDSEKTRKRSDRKRQQKGVKNKDKQYYRFFESTTLTQDALRFRRDFSRNRFEF